MMSRIRPFVLLCLGACGDPSGTDAAPVDAPGRDVPGADVPGLDAPRADTGPIAPDPAGPAVFFTDVTEGPTSGGPGGRGVPIAIFGHGFGSDRGTSTVTIGGVEVASYLVWGAHNAHNPMLDLIVVQPGSAVTGGAIEVHVNGRTSNDEYRFTVNGGSVYYVSTTGSDSADCSEATPCATLSHMIDGVLEAGDTVLIRGGTYSESEIWVRPMTGGQPGANITFARYPGEEPVFDNPARGFLADGRHVTISGLTFLNGKSIRLGDNDSRGNRAIDNTFTGTIGYDAIGTHGHDVLLAGNVCHVDGATTGTMGHCYYVSHGTNLRIAYNVGSGAPGYGLHIFDQNRTPSDPASDIRREISSVVVEGNLFYGSRLRSGIIIAMEDEGGLGNAIHDILIRNNLLRGNNHMGIVIGGIVSNVRILHNTFHENGRQGLYVGDASTLLDIVAANNLFYQTDSGLCDASCGCCSWYPLGHAQAAAPGILTLMGNFYGPMPPMLTGVTDGAAVSSAVTFSGAAMDDFRITSGMTLDAAPLHAECPRDFDGIGRPQGAMADFGAFELAVD